MNTTNAVYIKMANLTCCTARMKRSFLVWLWAVHRAVSVEQPTITAKELTGIIEAWKAGDLELARERQNFAQEVINVICHYRGNIVGGKRIMKLIGLDLGKNRTPFQNMTDEEEAAMKAELEAINFFERCNK